jgi:hypothetical protein
MILPPGVYQSIDKNGIEIGEGWVTSTLPIWAPGYSQELDQPISISAVDLEGLRFVGAKTTITIRQTHEATSLVLWSGIATLIDDPTGGGGGPTDLPLHGMLPGRAASGSHPVSAISGLPDALVTLETEIAGKEPAFTVLPATKGGTGQPLYAIGDILAADTVTTLSRLPDVATGSALLSGGIDTLPTWGQISNIHVATGAAIAWSKISKSGASPGDVGAAPAFVSAAANLFWATPSGASGVPSLRAIAAVDIPDLDTAKITTGTFADARIASAATWNAKLGTSNVSGTARQLARFIGANTVGSDGGFKTDQVSSSTVGLYLGSGLVASPTYLLLDGAANQAKRLVFMDAGVGRWAIDQIATSAQFRIRAIAGGVDVDNPVAIDNAAGGTIALGGTTSRPVNCKFSLQINGVDAITSARKGSLTGLDVTGRIFSTVSGVATSTAALVVSSANPAMILNATSNSVDAKIWRISAYGAGQFGIDSYNDAESSAIPVLNFSRAAGVVTTTVGATGGTVNIAGTVNLSSGPLQVAGVDTISAARFGLFSNGDDASGTLRAGEACMGRKNGSGGTTAWFGFTGLNSAVNTNYGAFFTSTQSRFAGGGDFILLGASASQISVAGAFTISAGSPIAQSSTEFSGKVGYKDGIGTAQTQATSKSTTVAFPSGKTCGTITMNAAALAANATVSFSLTSDQISPNDQIVITHSSGGTMGAYGFAVFPSSSTSTIYVRNLTGGSLSEAIILRIMILRSTVA